MAVWLTSGPAMTVIAVGGALAMALFAAALPDAALGIALAPIVVTGLTWLVARRVRAHTDVAFLQGPFWAGVVLRVLAVGAQLAIGFLLYRGQVDFVGYWEHAQQLVDRVVVDGRVDLLFDTAFIDYYFVTRSTFVLAVVLTLMMLIVGPNIVALFLLGVPVSAAGAYLFYRAFEPLAPDAASRRRYALMLFLFPSLAFWSVFLGKDVWVFFLMGCTTLAMSRILHAVRIGPLLALGTSLSMVTLLRPHVGGTLLLAVVAVLALRPLRVRGPALYLRPVLQICVTAGLLYGFTTIVASALSNIGVAALTVEALTERAFMAHTGFATTEGGGALPIAIDSRNPADVAAFIPLGVATLLFRPFVWEAHNAMAVVAGLENLFLLGLVLWRLPSLWRGVAMMRRHPMAAFVVVAFLTTSAVLAFDWNLGATQRHRTMVLPFLFMLIALPRGRAERATAKAPA